jgi:hypothetical protein
MSGLVANGEISLSFEPSARMCHVLIPWATIITAHVGVLPLADLFYSRFQLFSSQKQVQE